MVKILFVVAIISLFVTLRRSTRRTLTAPTGKVWDLFTDMLSQPHLLIAGATGSGKSVAINGLLNTLLYRLPTDEGRTDGPDGVQLILIDPKRVELAAYAKLPHTLAHAAGFNPTAWLEALNKAVKIMDDRYTYMEKRHLKLYDKGDLYVVIDEWANVYKNGGKDAYRAVLRLISEGRAARVHRGTARLHQSGTNRRLDRHFVCARGKCRAPEGKELVDPGRQVCLQPQAVRLVHLLNIAE